MALDLDPKRGTCLVTRDNVFRGLPVKHPFSRLISAWHQKLRRNDDMYKMFLLEAFPHMKSYVSDKDKDHIISFPDFMRFFLCILNFLLTNKFVFTYHCSELER